MRVICLIALCLPCAVMAQAQTPALPADVNRDGLVDVLDVQGGINQALGAAAPTSEADLNADTAVDVRDVQNLINSALGTGGVYQVVSGTIVPAAPKQLLSPLSAVAVSDKGLIARISVQADGQFSVPLRTGMGWSFALLDEHNLLQGWLAVPLGGYTSITVPLPDLSLGGLMDLGQVPLGMGQPIGTNALHLLSDALAPILPTDANANGLADFIDPLFQSLLSTIQGLTLLLPPEANPMTDLINRIGQCATAHLDEISRPSLLDANANSMPDFSEAFFGNLATAFTQWFEQFDWTGTPIAAWMADDDGDGIPWIVEMQMSYLAGEVPSWMHGLGRPETVDDNGNGIPDFLESRVVIPGFLNEDRTPALSRDENGNGVPDFLEAVTRPADDNDGDGISDAVDLDDDNDGLPDYADAQPLIPAT